MDTVPVSLELKASAFYERLRGPEAELVREIVDHVSLYMIGVTSRPSLVSSVGSLLRYDDATRAEDIDTAIAGLKYFDLQQNGGMTEVPLHVIRARSFFTQIASGYFDCLTSHFEHRGFTPTWKIDKSLERDRSVELRRENESIGVASQVEDFTYYGSKGLKVTHDGGRPVHVHFVFNSTPEEWRAWQATLEDPPTKRQPGKSPHFLYAVLHERK